MVRQIMRHENLVACQLRSKARTMVPAADLKERPNRVKRDFKVSAPARKRVGDITYIRTWQGFVYLETVMDCYSKKIIGYALADRMKTSLIQKALAMAARACPPITGVTIFHSDRGVQYTSDDYTATMKTYSTLASVGRTSICYDNAATESFNATCKKELINRKIYPTKRKAITDVTSWIELCSNHSRPHSALDYRTPNEVRQELTPNQKTA